MKTIRGGGGVFDFHEAMIDRIQNGFFGNSCSTYTNENVELVLILAFPPQPERPRLSK